MPNQKKPKKYVYKTHTPTQRPTKMPRSNSGLLNEYSLKIGQIFYDPKVNTSYEIIQDQRFGKHPGCMSLKR